MSDTTEITSTQHYPKYDHGSVHMKPDEQTDSKEWFQYEPKYVKVENETTVEAFVCGICSEHASCKDDFCEHVRSHCCLDINKSEPICTVKKISKQIMTLVIISQQHIM